MTRERVCLSRCESYDVDKIEAIVREHIDALGGVDALLSNGTNVVVKPNLVLAKDPSHGATTHPALVEAVCRIFVKAGAKVTIAESSGGLYNKAVMGMTFRTCGIEQAARASGASLCEDFSERQLSREENLKCRWFSVITPIAEADLIIDLPKLKTHTLTTYSGAVKNMFGVIPGVQKVEMHSRFPDIDDFCDMIVDLNETVKTRLCICDAVEVMEGNGPTSGKKTDMGYIISSLSPYALDVVGASLAKLELSKVPMLMAAQRRGIIKAELSSVELWGTEIEGKKLALPDTVDKRFEMLSYAFGGRIKRFLASKPTVNKKRCRGCGDCVRNCPKKLISIEKGVAKIRRDGCIFCFCCHELCKFHAIDIKRPFISKI